MNSSPTTAQGTPTGVNVNIVPGDTREVQYFIATRSGGWAMWITCPATELEDHDAIVAAIIPTEGDAPPTGGGHQAGRAPRRRSFPA